MTIYPHLSWSAPREAVFRDSYLDWHALLTGRLDALDPVTPTKGTAFEPVFVRLVGEDRAAARKALGSLLVTDPALLIDEHERAILEDTASADIEEFALYRRVGTQDARHDAVFEVIDTGVPLLLADEDTPAVGISHLQAADAPWAAGQPIVAVIDDGIGFLNKRFRRGSQSRFHAVWLQALETRAADGGILSGMVLDQSQISDMFSRDEAAAYTTLDEVLKGPPGRFARAHGTQVLDLAAGADSDSGDPVADWPLLAVSLPPQMVDDTSGTGMESYMLQGLRWVLQQARQIDATAPVIVNLSLGVSAGPKDGSGFLACQMAREAERWEQRTGQPVRLVWSFGNGFRADLAARVPSDMPSAAVDMRVLPDDRTASYLEIRPSGALSLRITPPEGPASDWVTLDEGTVQSLEDAQGRAVARLYHQPARSRGEGVTEPAHYVLALAPTTARKAAEPVAPAGQWRLELSGDGARGADIVIQRDDSLPGSTKRGRQAYFDHSASYSWDTATSDYTSPKPPSPVQRAGGCNSLCSAASRQTFAVGAAMHVGRTGAKDPANYLPAVYTAQGAPWGMAGPTVSAVVEDGMAGLGLPATALLSGSVSRIRGTSAAAGVITRALALSADRLRVNARNPQSTHLQDFEPDALDLFEVPDCHADRLGGYVVAPLPARVPSETVAV
ncbi:hypothetical protein [Sagittula sp. SSi028]|uniref:hypothetical protein n=1 Tax=Sagittula sp. SSi028 TaxID=3400636 RepID=UPI003AF566DD